MASGYRFLRNGLLLLLTGTLLLPVLFSGCRSHKKKSGKAKYAANRGAKVQKNGIMPDTRLKARNGREARKEAQEVIKTARSYLGTPYKPGGVSRLGMDCSGLVVTAFENVIPDLPRNSAAQAASGKPVPVSELQPGDLLFFSDRKLGSGITHVGLVTEVNGTDVQFIHASGKLGVVEVPFSGSYFQKTFTKAVRPEW